ncbi:hypothetical protein J1N35_031945 [Gossypium stocksii]|uniref:Uncharacterized protein n=1 Tax=Gossypium stocksii TaxID=47602 RepID=A0A9D3V2L5_9ROSI|nr:hypothetical protein J1N35_031945 [Gossypium stocksii]
MLILHPQEKTFSLGFGLCRCFLCFSSKTRESNLRPLSPHLPDYKPQLSATLSITNRISGAFLATTLLVSKTCPSYRLNCCLGRVLSSVLWGSSFIGRFFGKAEVKNGVLKSGPSFLRRRRRGMMLFSFKYTDLLARRAVLWFEPFWV